MALIDTVRCYATVPGSELLGDREYQTKDFGCRFDRFTIGRDGRLIHHRPVYQSDEPFAPPTAYEDVVVSIHRDARLSGEDEFGAYRQFYARFTDGVLQWVKPWEELSEAQREYAVTGAS